MNQIKTVTAIAVIYVATGVLGLMLPNASFAASPFLVTRSSIETFSDDADGRAQYYKANRKSITLAESLVHLRQCHMSEQKTSEFEQPPLQNQTLPQLSPTHSSKVFLPQAQAPAQTPAQAQAQ